MARQKGILHEEVIQVLTAPEMALEREGTFDRAAISLRDKGIHTISRR